MSITLRQPAKLTIVAYSDRNRVHRVDRMSVRYNPDSVNLGYRTEYAAENFINTSEETNRYVRTRPGGLSIELLFDATMPGNWGSIDRQIARLKTVCYDVHAASQEPRYLNIYWGRMSWNNHGYFPGRITGMSVRYTLFERDAEPIRATVLLELMADDSSLLQGAKGQLESPNRVVIDMPDATSLAAVAAQTSAFLAGYVTYLAIAADNDLDSPDATSPGDSVQVSTNTEA
ncbi:hypothetical protein [Pararobbsia silviterrae]|uniref:Contractile injection system tube protein N-terminal domain-containing protein n=1 Tax=Pararobbsia silviterrae TaxID=1792498 RepID=A0A494Y1V1_9BURK|nr:hypothetical protein [Pararobbsia silviterrae]RKP55968.1 hypothetical protein D7S86_12330 [Pararobbsia silviterrae]